MQKPRPGRHVLAGSRRLDEKVIVIALQGDEEVALAARTRHDALDDAMGVGAAVHVVAREHDLGMGLPRGGVSLDRIEKLGEEVKSAVDIADRISHGLHRHRFIVRGLGTPGFRPAPRPL